jgi:mevalonate kinase
MEPVAVVLLRVVVVVSSSDSVVSSASVVVSSSEAVTTLVVVCVVGSAEGLSVTVKVTTTVEGLPSMMVVRVVVIVIGEFVWVELWTAVLVRVAEALGTPKLQVSTRWQNESMVHLHPSPSQT